MARQPAPSDKHERGEETRSCAFCERTDAPLTLSLTTLVPGQSGRRRILWACRDCAAEAESYSALIVALMRRAVSPSSTAPDAPLADGIEQRCLGG